MEAVFNPRIWFGVLVGILILTIARDAHAEQKAPASAPDANKNPQERWLKEQQDRLKQQQAPYKKVPNVFLQKQLIEKSKGEKEKQESNRCFKVDKLNFFGVHSLSIEDFNLLKKKYEKQCLGLKDIQSIIKDTTNLYIKKGFITSRAFVKPQSLSTGTLDVTVVEGKIDHLLSVDKNLTALQIASAFPTGSGKVLNLRDLEEGLEQLNRLPMNNATMELVPGSKTGDSTVALKNKKQQWWRGSLGLTNQDSDRFGVGLLDGNLAVDNLFGVNDSLLFSASTELGHYNLYEKSNSYSFLGSIPYGYWLFGISTSYFDYAQTIKGQVVNFLSHGSASVNAFTISNMIYRGRKDKLKVKAELTRKQTKNYIEDVYLETSSRVLYIFSLGFDYDRYLQNGGALSLGFKWDKSMPWWGATEKVVSAEDAYQFDKYEMNLSYQNRLHFLGGDFDYLLNGTYLYSPKIIVASEGISIGGRYDVRGFYGNSLFGYQGGYIRNELGHIFSLENKKFRPYGDIDIGSVKVDDGIESGYKELVGVSIGMQLIGANTSVDLIYSQAIYSPNFYQANKHTLYASVRINF